MTITLPMTLVNYHLDNKESHLSYQKLVFQQSLLITFSLAGLLYAAPAAAHADNPQDIALNVLGTCSTAVLMFYVATDMFFKQHIDRQVVPENLNAILQSPLTPDEYRFQNWVIGSCALISAVPFSTTAIAYPLDIPLPLFIMFVIYILIANTVLHFLPVKLTIEHPVYGALPRWIKVAFNYLINNKKTDSEMRLFNEKIRLQSVRQEWVERIAHAKEHFFVSLILSPGQIDGKQLNEFISKTSQEKFEHLLTFEAPIKSLPIFLLYTARFVGAVIVLASCLGYAANPYLVFLDRTKIWWAATLICAMPLYFFGVLLAYFGDGYGERILTDLMLWGNDAVKLPIEVRLYPKLMSSLVLINVFLLVYSPAAAEEMMEFTFKSVVSPEVMTMLNLFARIGISILAWYAPLDFEKLMLRYIVQYTQKNESQKIMMLYVQLTALEQDVLRLSDQVVLDMSQNDVELNSTPQNINLEEKQQQQPISWCNCLWFKKEKQTNSDEFRISLLAASNDKH